MRKKIVFDIRFAAKKVCMNQILKVTLIHDPSIKASLKS